jgi:hypothetical protein
VQGLRYSSSDGLCGLVEYLHRFANFRNAQEQQRCLCCGLDSAIAVVDIDAGIAESRRSFCQRADAIREFHLSHFRLRKIQPPIFQNRFCCDLLRDANLSPEVAIELHPLHLPEARTHLKVA